MASAHMEEARALLASFKEKKADRIQRAEKSAELAALILEESKNSETCQERKKQEELASLVEDPKGKVFLTSLTDQCFRSQSSRRIADQFVYLLSSEGRPRFLPTSKKLALYIGQFVAPLFPGLFVPLLRRMIYKETRNVILPGEEKALLAHISKRISQGVRVNLNHLGEAILGEKEAQKRLHVYLNDLEKKEIEYVSIKVSTIASQLNLLAWEDTLSVLVRRLKQLFRVAKDREFTREDGEVVPKFVNLDMEEYRDLHLTCDLFKRVLDEPEFFHYSAGIVLQSYLPDSWIILQQLTLWAQQRVAAGGAPIKIRIVKGANLAMERVEASIKGWPQAPFQEKWEVDANYKKMVEFSTDKQRAKAVHIGIASHNLFDIAYALLLAKENGVEEYLSFEMLEGMAESTSRVIHELSGGMLLYCPAAKKEEFQNAVAYLVRRLDENTAQDNFLKDTFSMKPGSLEWEDQKKRFIDACMKEEEVSWTPRRTQNRLSEITSETQKDKFINEPDTDWTLPHNRKWGEATLARWKEKQIDTVPVVVGGEEITENRNIKEGIDPSRPYEAFFQYAVASAEDIEKALNVAERAEKWWRNTKSEEKAALLKRSASALREARSELLGAMLAEGGKVLAEGDPEVSEAIDFAEYYAYSLIDWKSHNELELKAKGVALVASPWNFPCSIPAGGILSSLAAGNPVIFKPAPEGVLVGWYLVQALWKAGIPRDLLQFLPCDDEPEGSLLIEDPRVHSVLLTGSTETAKKFLRMRPGMDLVAETGGKNAIIVTALADRDLAVRDIVASSFGHAGQKCSACSLLILEDEVYYDPRFKEQLRDAASSLKVGSSWNLSTKVPPLIRPPLPHLHKALTTLEEGEEWLLAPKNHPENPHLYSPGIKWGVKRGSFSHTTEFFGPVLSVMRAKNLDEAISLANATPYGLTSGLHSLDTREHAYWIKRIRAGNLYINRGITGAIVERQPFGGCKESSFGVTAKAGGPNILARLMKVEEQQLPEDILPLDASSRALLQAFSVELSPDETARVEKAIGSYLFAFETYFSHGHDPAKLLGQDNVLSYVPYRFITLRLQEGDSLADIALVIAACRIAHVRLEISLEAPKSPLEKVSGVVMTLENEETFLERIRAKTLRRVRILGAPTPACQEALAFSACHAVCARPISFGRYELLNFMREIALSYDYHRYGNLGSRENEPRSIVL